MFGRPARCAGRKETGEPMETQETLPRIYRELADWYERRAEPSMRDRFLVLAMDAAYRAGHPEEAEQLRRRLLQVNPHHLLRPYATVAEASQAADVQTYLRDLRMNYPSEVAQVLLRSLRANTHRLAPEVAPSAHASNGASAEPLKVFYGPETTRPATNGPPATAAPRPAPAPLRSEPDPLPVAPALPRKQPNAETWPPVRPRAKAVPPRGGWFGLVLFVVVFLLGVALAGYVVARPFVPALVNAVKMPVADR